MQSRKCLLSVLPHGSSATLYTLAAPVWGFIKAVAALYSEPYQAVQ